MKNVNELKSNNDNLKSTKEKELADYVRE